MSFRGFYRIVRPGNSFVAGLAAVLAYLLATGTLVPGVILPFIIVILITGAGNTINDYFDLPIDRINRPGRPLPSGQISARQALWFSIFLFTAGIVISLFTTPICIFFAVVNSVLLVIYAARLKKTPFAGNIVVAYLSGSIFLFGGGFAGFLGLVNNIVIALITFLAMVAREIMKDAEDVPGDVVKGAKTLPIICGIQIATRVAVAFSLGAVVISFYPYFRFGIWYIAGIIPVDLIILYAAVRSSRCHEPECIRQSRATELIKYGMFASLVVFALSAIFLTTPAV
ncbi:MAG TPA: geranylgeranylglycerol-phosphate geranylgeranyltransferase [Methanoregulaceae archaeon]|nr:geranylgeranylglycerol-phosphate geranylgeranyltransferase [Methanoregulaceae archaeon]